MSPLQLCLLFSSVLFCVGLVGALSRSNTILVLLGIELMLNAANLNFIAFWRYGPPTPPATGVVLVLIDGVGDVPGPPGGALAGVTPLQAAATPVLDAVAGQ